MIERVSHKEKIVRVLMGRENKRLWFTHAKLKKEVNERYSNDMIEGTTLTPYLLELIKLGYVERAVKPRGLWDRHTKKVSYIYRWTGKAFRKVQDYGKFVNPEAIKQGRAIYHANRSLPRWFRRMMRD